MPSDRVLTLPNLVSFLRLLGVGWFWWVLLGADDVVTAAWLVFGIGWTDWIDGYLARRLDQVSRLGKVLDPVADRLMIASAVVGGLVAGVLPVGIGLALITREVFVAVPALILLWRGLGAIEVRYLGKVATFLLYGAVPAFYLAAAGVADAVLTPAAWVAGVVGLVLYWYVAFLYLGDARRRMTGLESPRREEQEA